MWIKKKILQFENLLKINLEPINSMELKHLNVNKFDENQTETYNKED
jgi:hypothetical protein